MLRFAILRYFPNRSSGENRWGPACIVSTAHVLHVWPMVYVAHDVQYRIFLLIFISLIEFEELLLEIVFSRKKGQVTTLAKKDHTLFTVGGGRPDDSSDEKISGH